MTSSWQSQIYELSRDIGALESRRRCFGCREEEKAVDRGKSTHAARSAMNEAGRISATDQAQWQQVPASCPATALQARTFMG